MKETTKEKIIRKLTSRKLWMAVCAFVSLLIVAMGYTDTQAAQVTALIMAGASVLCYIIGEGMTDAAAVNTEKEEKEKEHSEYSTSAIGFAADLDE